MQHLYLIDLLFLFALQIKSNPISLIFFLCSSKAMADSFWYFRFKLKCHLHKEAFSDYPK